MLIMIQLFSLNSISFWTEILLNTDISDWFTLTGGVLSGVIAGALTFFGVKLTIGHNDKNENTKRKPRLEVLDHRLLLRNGLTWDERDEIVITIQNFGGTIAKNIEATVYFNDFDKLTGDVHEVLKGEIEPPFQIVSRAFTTGDTKVRAAYLIFKNLLNIGNGITEDVHYGTLNERYFRMTGNCVPINVNYSAKTEVVLPRDVHGWISFYTGHNHNNYLEEGLFDFTLELKYFSIENEEYKKKFTLTFIDTKTYEVLNGSSEKLIILRAKEIV